MAWYRCGGGGLPAGLQSDMDTVLNKKFSTSTTYPPTDWPGTVNLMGPLPEKTASGTIAHITDGADGVPLKNWLVTLPANLSGYSEVNGAQNGKNFLDDTLLNLEQGSINGSTGNNENANNRVRSIHAIPFPYDKIVSSYTWTIPSGYKVAIRPYDKDGNFVQLPSWALAFVTQLPMDLVGHGITQMRFVLAKNDNTAITPSDMANIGFQIEVGSTATAYEAYEAPTLYTASLGRTIYGGTADIVTGEGEDGFIKYVIDGVNNYAINVSGTNFNIMPYGLFIDGTVTEWVCDAIPASGTNFGYNSSQGFIFIRQAGWSSLTGVTDVASFNAYCQQNPITLILPKTTADAFTFTPITPTPETALGVNNFWADEGDSDVTYRADISLALQALGGGGRGLMGMMMRPIENEEIETEEPDDELDR